MLYIPDLLFCLTLRVDGAAHSGVCMPSPREEKDECPEFRPSNIFLKLKDLGQLSLRPNVRTIPNLLLSVYDRSLHTLSFISLFFFSLPQIV